MFKRLRERITEEASKSVAQLGNNSIRSLSESDSKPTSANSSEDLITLSESSAVVVPHTSLQQFSIGEEEEGSLSEQSTPQRNVDVSNGSASQSKSSAKDHSVGVDVSFSQEYRPKRLSYVPQSDIESEREEPPTLNLEGISKEQLLSVIDVLKARTYKYKNKYSEVVKNFKELRDEKMKIEKTLIDTQDKGSRRIAELREQCQLEQSAKAHLEDNLRLLLEEKDNRITVLETQVNFLKDSKKAEESRLLVDPDSQSIELSNADLLTGDSISQCSSASQEKIERLEHQYSQAKKTITSQTEQISLLRKQNESLSQELEEKIKKLNDLEDQQAVLKSEHESVLMKMQIRLEELEKQQEESAMAMAETKRNMHEELELKEKQLVKAEKEANQYQLAVENEKQKIIELQKQYEEKISELQRQLESTEKTLEDEKQNLMQELARGKTAAITLMQKDCAQKISAIEEEWKLKLQDLQSQKFKNENDEKHFIEIKEKLKQSDKQIQELNSLVIQLEKENESLKSENEKLKSATADSQHKENLETLKNKYDGIEKTYVAQLEEMKQKLTTLENEKRLLEENNLKLVKTNEKILETKSQQIVDEEKLKKEHLEKVQLLQKKVDDKENQISKLESAIKKNSEKAENFKKKIKSLEQEREQLMHEAQERVSETEAKCREDIVILQKENNKLSSENKELEQLKDKLCLLEKEKQENAIVLESTKEKCNEEISHLNKQIEKLKEELLSVETDKQGIINKLQEQLQKYKEESSNLANKSVHLEDLKSEKEALNEKLKQAELQVSSVKKLESERDSLKLENASLLEQLELLKSSQINDEPSILLKFQSLEESIEDFPDAKLKSDVTELKNSFCKEINSLKTKNEYLSKQISILENISAFDPNSASVKKYIEAVRKESDDAIKEKEEEFLKKCEIIIRDHAQEMVKKDREYDEMSHELLERNQELEARLRKEHKDEIAELRQNLFEKECALDDIRDDYEEKLQEKDKKLKEYELMLKSLPHSSNGISPDSALMTAESSDWDDTWAVPDETIESNTSPIHSNSNCEEHLQQIEALKEELSKSNSEIKELKVLLRLSPPDSMDQKVNNNNRKDSLQSIPEPTEFEYLKNIIYEYMMGKEPVTLAKVIAAVLRFSEAQTQQVIRKEESRHQTK